MLSRSVGLVAACAASASAFLLPPNVNSAVNALEASPFAVQGNSILFNLPCSECAFGRGNVETAENSEDSRLWIQGGAHDLLFNITISEDRQTVLLGDSPIYPATEEFHAMFEPVVHQIPAGADVSKLQPEQMTPLQVTNSMSVYHDSTVDFEIMALDSHPVRVGGVSIKVITLPEGIMALAVEAKHPSPAADGFRTPGQHPHPPKECKNLPGAICAIKQMVEAQFHSLKHGAARKFRPCPGRKGGPHHGPGHDGGPMRHHGRPHHGRPHGHHEHHHRHGFRTFVRAFARGFLAVLVPIMAGIAVGMGVSVLGLLISRLISFVWSKFSSRGSYVEIPQEARFVEQDGKLIAEMEAPPVYEDSPPYEEIEKA